MPQSEVEEHFSLKWNDYQSNLTIGFQHLLEEEIMLDVSLSAGGQLIQAHKIVLSICSPYFKNVFQSNPCKHPVIILKDVGAEELLDILEFMYRGEVNVKKEKLAAFLRLAESLQVKGLADGKDDKDEPVANELEKKKECRTSKFLNSEMQQNLNKSSHVPPKRKRKRLSLLAKYLEMSRKRRKLMRMKEDVKNTEQTEEKDKENQSNIGGNKTENGCNTSSDENTDTHQGSSNTEERAEDIPPDLRQMLINAKHVEFIRREDCSMGITSKGGKKLTCRSYEYNLNLCKLKNNMQTLYWKCSKYVKTRCYARIIMLPNGITKLTGYHNHQPTA